MSNSIETKASRLVKLEIPRGHHPVAGPDPVPAAPAGGPNAAIVAAIENLNRQFGEFRTKNDERLSQIEARGTDDVVTREHVDRINAQITETQNGINALVAQLTVQGATAGGDPASAQRREYVNRFAAFMRDGDRRAMASVPNPRAEMSTLSDPDGGVLVPEEVEAAIGRVQQATSVLRSICTVTQTTAAVWKRRHSLGGATSGWVGEKAPRTQTGTPTYSELTWEAHEMYAQPSITQTLLDDAPMNMIEELGREIAISFNDRENAAFFTGSGVGQPKGFIAETKVANASWAWGKLGFFVTGVAAALSDANNNGVDPLIDMVYGLKAAYRTNARWLMNDATTAAVRKLKDADDKYLWQPPITAGEPATILGYALSSDDNAPDIGANEFPIAFGDFSRGYRIIDRTGIRVLVDPFTDKPNVLVYTTKRVGGGVNDFEAIKLLKCST